MAKPLPGLALCAAMLACVIQANQTACQETGDRPNGSSSLWLHAYVMSLNSDGDMTNIQELEDIIGAASDEAVEKFSIPLLMQHWEIISIDEKRKRDQNGLGTLGWTWGLVGGIAYRSHAPVNDSDLQALAEALHPRSPLALSLPAKSPVTKNGLAPLLMGQNVPLSTLSSPFSRIGDDSLRRLVEIQADPAHEPFLYELQKSLHPDQTLWLFLTQAKQQPNLASTWVRSLRMKKLAVTRACGSTHSEVPSAIDFLLQHAKQNPEMLPHFFSKINPNILVHRALARSGLSQLNSFPTRGLNLAGTNVTDIGLRHIAKLDGVQDLDLSSTKISDAGVDALRGVKVQKLRLRGTPISDASIDTLMRMRDLVLLDLSDTNVTAEGVASLAASSSLKALAVGGPNFSAEKAISVYESMPSLEAINLPVPARTLNPTLLATRLPVIFSHYGTRQSHHLSRPISKTITGGEADNFTFTRSLAISEDERRLSVLTASNGSVGNSCAVHCVDLKTGKISRVQFPDWGKPNRLKRLHFSPDGSLVAATYFPPKSVPPTQDATPAQTLSVWRLPTKSEAEAKLVGSRNIANATRSLAFTRNNQTLAIATEGSFEMLEVGNQLQTVDQWPTDSSQTDFKLHPSTEFAISPSGRYIAGTSSTKGLLLIDLQKETATTILASDYQSDANGIGSPAGFYHRMRIAAFARQNKCYFNSDGSKLYADVRITGRGGGNRTRRMMIYDMKANRITASLAFEIATAVSADGDWCITSDANNTYHWSLQGGVPAEFAFVQARSSASSIVLPGGKTVSARAGKAGLRIDIHELAK